MHERASHNFLRVFRPAFLWPFSRAEINPPDLPIALPSSPCVNRFLMRSGPRPSRRVLVIALLMLNTVEL